jgi:hypothetical protein
VLLCACCYNRWRLGEFSGLQGGLEGLHFNMELSQEGGEGISLLLIFLSMWGATVDNRRVLLLLGIRNWGSGGDHGRLEFVLVRVVRVGVDVYPGFEVIQLDGLQRALYGLPVHITLSGTLKRGAGAPRQAPGVLPDAETLLCAALKVSPTRDRGPTLVVQVSLSRKLRVSMWALNWGKSMSIVMTAICG